jgi:hypothetical protein
MEGKRSWYPDSLSVLLLISPSARAYSNASSKPLLYGNILHELLQTTLQTREFSAPALKACLDSLLQKPGFQLDIGSCGLGVEEVRGEVWEKAMQSLVGFGEKWVGAKPDVGFSSPVAELQIGLDSGNVC